MAVYVLDSAKLAEQLSEENIMGLNLKPEGQFASAAGSLLSAFQVTSKVKAGVCDFAISNEEVIQAAIGHLEKVIKGLIEPSANVDPEKLVINATTLRDMFKLEGQMLKRSNAKGRPVQSTMLAENFVSILAKNCD